MRSTLSSLLVVLLVSTAVSAIIDRRAAPHGTKASKKKTYGPLPAFKDSGTYYHHDSNQVPYYTNRPPGLNGVTREYWFSIEEIDYDYAPLGYDHFNGGPLNATVAAQWTVASPTRIGSVYMKAVYREYTDGTYTNRISHPDYMGFMGPIIRAEVGNTIQVTVRNMARFDFSFHVHGAYYNAASDGTNFTGAIGGKVVGPNQQYTYVFDIPERSGPGPKDPSSSIWAYYSNVRSTDIFSGLIGPMIIYKKGILNQFGYPDKSKLDNEVVTYLNVADENQSIYFKENVARFLGPKFVPDPTDTDFYDSNKMHHINGYVYANLDALQLASNQTVRWYIIGLGSMVDIHTAHWHGSTALEAGHRTDVISLLPASFRIADVSTDNPGQWLFHCHVSYHMMAGMVISYQINVASSEHGWSKRSHEEKARFVPTLKKYW